MGGCRGTARSRPTVHSGTSTPCARGGALPSRRAWSITCMRISFLRLAGWAGEIFRFFLRLRNFHGWSRPQALFHVAGWGVEAAIHFFSFYEYYYLQHVEVGGGCKKLTMQP